MNIKRIVDYYEFEFSKKEKKSIKVKKGEAIFHQFGMGYEEFEDGIGNYSIAIIELKDGSIINIDSNCIKFKKPLMG
jgi:hypothetical protein